MIGVHIGLDLEHKARNLWIARDDMGLCPSAQGLERLGRRRIGAKTGQQLINAKMAKR